VSPNLTSSTDLGGAVFVAGARGGERRGVLRRSDDSACRVRGAGLDPLDNQGTVASSGAATAAQRAAKPPRARSPGNVAQMIVVGKKVGQRRADSTENGCCPCLTVDGDLTGETGQAILVGDHRNAHHDAAVRLVLPLASCLIALASRAWP
jgi:hypothetical protein